MIDKKHFSSGEKQFSIFREYLLILLEFKKNYRNI